MAAKYLIHILVIFYSKLKRILIIKEVFYCLLLADIFINADIGSQYNYNIQSRGWYMMYIYWICNK